MYNVLVCDDDKAIVRSIEIYLKADSYNVFCAYDGAEALEIMEREKIHCIVMDMSPSLWQESFYMVSLFMTFTSSLKALQYCSVPLTCWLPGNFL